MNLERRGSLRLIAWGVITCMLISFWKVNVRAEETSLSIISDPKVEGSIDSAENWLAQMQNSDGSWDNEISQSIVTTTYTAGLFTKFNKNPESLNKAVTWINQQNAANQDFMLRMMPFINVQEKKSAMLTEILSSQNSDGGWGISKGYESDAWDTCMAIEKLLPKDEFDGEVINAINYLTNRQNEDGSWSLTSNSEGSIYLTAFIRTIIYEFKEKYRSDCSNVLEKSANWLISQRNDEGLWGSEDDDIYLSTQVFKALSGDWWQEVKAVPDKIIGRQDSNGSWKNNAYLTSLAADMLLLYSECTKVELADIKLYVNGIEKNAVSANSTVEIVPVYTGRDVNAEANIISPDGVKTPVVKDSSGRLIWNSGLSPEGAYEAEVTLKNDKGEAVNSIRRAFSVESYVNINQAYLEITPGTSKLNKPVSPVIRIFMDGDTNRISSRCILK